MKELQQRKKIRQDEYFDQWMNEESEWWRESESFLSIKSMTFLIVVVVVVAVVERQQSYQTRQQKKREKKNVIQ